MENHQEKEKTKDITLDFKAILKHKTVLLAILLLLIPIFASYHFRMYPDKLPIMDEQAKSRLDNYIRTQVENEINQQYPNLPQDNKNALIDKKVQETRTANKDQIEQQEKQLTENFKNYLKDENGVTYLIGIDPFFFYRYARNYVETGHIGDELKDGQEWDNHMVAPIGSGVASQFHIYFLAYFHKFLNFFDSGSTLEWATFFAPVLLSMLTVIPVFFIARRFGGNTAGIIAGLIVGLHASILSRTVGGFADTDPYVILFSCLAALFIIESFYAKNIKAGMIYSGLAGLTIGVYAFAWAGWWFTFDIIILGIIAHLIYETIIHYVKPTRQNHIIKEKHFLNVLKITGIFIVSSFILVSLIAGASSFFNGIKSPVNFLSIKEAVKADLWPNVYTTVAELNEVTLQQAMGNIGGALLISLALAGIMLILTRKNSEKNDTTDIMFIVGTALWSLISLTILKNSDNFIYLSALLIAPFAAKIIYSIYQKEELETKYAAILIMWFFAAMYSTKSGIRFVMIVIPIFSIGLGILLGKIEQAISKALSGEIKIREENKELAKFGVHAVLGAFMIGIILFLPLFSGNSLWKTAEAVAKSELPTPVSDTWVNHLQFIRDNSQENAIITSWWDYGHVFKAVADRPVTFDGGSQNTPQAHWVGKLLWTDDEKKSIGILRMLDCGANTAFEELNSKIENTDISVDILNDIVVLDKIEAKKILLEKVDEETANKVLEKTHCIPPEGFVIASEDMIGKAGVWSHFGSWDFKKAEIWADKDKIDSLGGIDYLTKEYGYSKEEASEIYYKIDSIANENEANSWVSSWPGVYGSGSCQKTKNATFACTIRLSNNQGIILDIDEKTFRTSIKTQDNKIAHLNSLSYVDEKGDFKIIIEDKDIVGYGATLLGNGDTRNIIMMDPSLPASVFIKMFYHKGSGLKYYDKFKEDVGTGFDIITYKANWDKLGEENNQ